MRLEPKLLQVWPNFGAVIFCKGKWYSRKINGSLLSLSCYFSEFHRLHLPGFAIFYLPYNPKLTDPEASQHKLTNRLNSAICSFLIKSQNAFPFQRDLSALCAVKGRFLMIADQSRTRNHDVRPSQNGSPTMEF